MAPTFLASVPSWPVIVGYSACCCSLNRGNAVSMATICLYMYYAKGKVCLFVGVNLLLGVCLFNGSQTGILQRMSQTSPRNAFTLSIYSKEVAITLYTSTVSLCIDHSQGTHPSHR